MAFPRGDVGIGRKHLGMPRGSGLFVSVPKAVSPATAVLDCRNQRLRDLQRTVSTALQSAHERQRLAKEF